MLPRNCSFRYEDIKSNLVEAVNRYCELESKENIIRFIENQIDNDRNKYKNRFIVVPKKGDVIERIKSDYLGVPKVVNNEKIYESNYKGEIGCSEEIDAQMEAIRDAALLMLMSNRVAKKLYDMCDKTEEKPKKEELRRKAGKWLGNKNRAFQSLVTCINILNYDNVENNPQYKINYGMKKDKEGNDTFIIDVPYTGQICIHMGSKENFENNLQKINMATKSALESRIKSKMLEKEKELYDKKNADGMSENEAKIYAENEIKKRYRSEISKMIAKIDGVKNIEDYNGELFEASSAIPLEMKILEISEMSEIMSKFKDLENPTAGEIAGFINEKNRSRFKYNPREIHYLAVKFGWNAEKIQLADRLSKIRTERENNPEYIKIQKVQALRKKKMSEKQVELAGKKAVIYTTPEERQNVEEHEKRQEKKSDKNKNQGNR